MIHPFKPIHPIQYGMQYGQIGIQKDSRVRYSGRILFSSVPTSLSTVFLLSFIFSYLLTFVLVTYTPSNHFLRFYLTTHFVARFSYIPNLYPESSNSLASRKHSSQVPEVAITATYLSSRA
jgi:hypothetical protein